MILSRTLPGLEAQLPKTSSNMFIAPGDAWTAFVSISEIFGSATSDLFIVDPYADDSLLKVYGSHLNPNVGVRVLVTDHVSAQKHIGKLQTAVPPWNTSHHSNQVELRAAAGKSIHDRIICVDRSKIWIVTQSFKDLATKAPATVTTFISDLEDQKRAAYEAIWANAKPL